MKIKIFLIGLLLIGLGCQEYQGNSKLSEDQSTIALAARSVLERTLGNKAQTIILDTLPLIDGRDQYTYGASQGKLTVKGSSATALTRGVYDYLKDHNLGMLDWSGPHFRIPDKWPDTESKTVVTPFKIRHAYNAVTSGYSTPYWDWPRWEQELDWQAIHGFNMLMASVATEAIATRVWQKLGLTNEEINDFYGGPAHMPWHRMGCVENLGGNLPPEWHKDQIALQHKILSRMRELGIRPVVQSFGGFVPKTIARLYPDINLHNTLWNAGFPPEQRPVLLGPNEDLFRTITKMFMEEWQKEFGKEDYYLVDSFNELELPENEKPVTERLAEYGEKTFQAIKSGNPDAVWVIQGWMFAYQRNIWNPETVKALFSRVPDEEVLILDYANDYNNNWEPMNSFNGKQWVYGFVPNMGGKTAYTGDLQLYASGAARALASPDKKNLVGFTISGEGLENNTVIYELLTDVAWSSDSINLDNWLKNYSVARYGACPEAITESWKLLRASCYSVLEPHPQFGWQLGRLRHGSVNSSAEFNRATQLFLSCDGELGASECYRADALERAALTLGLKADEWFTVAGEAFNAGKTEIGGKAGERGLELLTEIDKLLVSHPLLRLDSWLDFARSHSSNPDLQQFYIKNAKQIITTWGPPVNDYACRVWSGLIRDFYRERMRKVLEAAKSGERFNTVPWEVEWVDNPKPISTIEPYTDPVSAAVQLVDKAMNETLPEIYKSEGETIGDWSPANITTNWSTVGWPISLGQLAKLKGIRFMYVRGNHRLEIRNLALIADGRKVARDEHFGYAGNTNLLNTYLLELPENVNANNGAVIRAEIRGSGGTDSYGNLRIITE